MNITLSVKPYVQNGRIMLGVRDIATLLGVDSKNTYGMLKANPF